MTGPAPTLPPVLATRYRLEAPVENGGWRALDLRHSRAVTIFIVSAAPAGPSAGSSRERATRLSHPTILPLLEALEADGLLFLVYPVVEGTPVADQLAERRPLSVTTAVRILRDVADALAYAHGRGVVHGAVGPATVITSGRHAILAGFGTAGGEGREADDLQALGRLGLALLSGRPAEQSGSDQLALERPEVPAELLAVLDRCLSADTDGPESAARVLAALEPLGTPSGGLPPNPPARPIFWRRWAGAALGLAAMVLIWVLARSPATTPPVFHARQATYAGDITRAVLSPDGQQIATLFRSGQGFRLSVQDLRGGRALELATAQWMSPPTWSRDGATLRYIQRDSAGFSIFAVPRLGGPARRTGAASINISIAIPALSPDGTRLVQVLPSPAGLQITELASGDSTLIPLVAPYTWIGDLVWSAQGNRLAVVTAASDRNGWALLVLSLGEGDQRVLAHDRREIGGAVFAPDGRALFYLRSAGRLKTLMRQRLDHQGAPVGPPVAVGTDVDFGPSTPDDVDPPRLSISDDGQRIAYVRRQVESNLRLLPLDHRGAERSLTMGTGMNQHARFAPDDSAVAYVRSESRGVSLTLLRLATGRSTVVTAAEEIPDVAWSPDGGSIAATSQAGDSGMGINLVTLETGTSRRFALGEVSSELAWRDGGRLVLQRPGNRSFALVSVATGRLEELDHVRDQGFVFSPRVSPDGRWLAFSWNGHERIPGLYLASLTDTAVRMVDAGRDLEPVRWSRDGRTVYAAHRGLIQEVPEVYAYPTAGGSPRLLIRLPEGEVIEDITRDGRWLLVRREARRSDVWLLEPTPTSP